MQSRMEQNRRDGFLNARILAHLVEYNMTRVEEAKMFCWRLVVTWVAVTLISGSVMPTLTNAPRYISMIPFFQLVYY